MNWIHPNHIFRTRARFVALTTALLLSLVFLLSTTAQTPIVESSSAFSNAVGDNSNTLPLPPPYPPAENLEESDDTCASQYGTNYIRDFVQSKTAYCDNTSTASLTCFSSKAHNNRLDTLCVGGPADTSVSEGSVTLACNLRELNQEDHAEHSPALNRFSTYWYNTGPKAIFNDFIRFEPKQDGLVTEIRAVDNVLFLVKREDTVANLWHTLMQVMSLTLSLDILRMAVDPNTGSPYFDYRDVRNSRVLILDQYEEGPFFDLWTMFTGLSPVRLGDDTTLTSSKMVVPLPGASNPMWAGDWVDVPCNGSSLLEVFSKRILEHYQIPVDQPKKTQLTLTLIDRSSTRQLRNQSTYVAALRKRFPDIRVHIVDFAAISFLDQIRLVRSTDLLVGVHGAGLTHEMFLPRGSTVVEILPPTLDYKGFANMAKLLGHQYFGRHGTSHPDDTGDWQADDVSIDENSFLELVGEAIANLKD
jgi:protein O-GlcNAc transferase